MKVICFYYNEFLCGAGSPNQFLLCGWYTVYSVTEKLPRMNQVQIKGKVVMMTGGAGGLGRALADLVLTRGGDVYLCDTNEDELNKVKDTLKKKHVDGKVGVAVLDVRKKDDWEAAWRGCEEDVGMPAVVVNIAGIKGEQRWEEVYDVNLVS